ncbi:hypothetical protein QC762_511743 [Podospora pseudocomata]|uniref:Uncharacterized protein n=1 Tax=Podospora pseudocomata TaxID=2093779 RepID=A0ABR0GBV8_9PEZI|nr:hypothetical protein QC762_511743 [Podospora pseudocomata]
MTPHDTPNNPDLRNIDPLLYRHMQPTTHNPTNVPQPTHPPNDYSNPPPVRGPTSSLPGHHVSVSFTPGHRHVPPEQPCPPPVYLGHHQPTASRPAYALTQQQYQQFTSSTQPPTQQTSAVFPIAPRLPPQTITRKSNNPPGRIIHTLLPPKTHIIRPDTPIRPFILSLPLGAPFHKRYKALLRCTRKHGSALMETFTAGPYFSYRDPSNNQVHFLINDIMVPDGRWSDELTYEVQVMESGLGVLDKEKKTWGNHWRETEEEREGVVKYGGKSERGVKLYWYGEGVEVEGWEEEGEEEVGRVLEGAYGWVS